MTKRDVAVSFCRAIALMGMIQAAFGLVRVGLLHHLASSVSFSSLSLWQLPLSFGLYLFVWFLARGIGAELVTPREADGIVTSSATLTPLLVRVVGLWLFLSASISFGPMFLGWVYDHFANRSAAPTMAFASPGDGWMMSNLIVGFAQSVVGLLLAFAPRIRAFFRS